MKTSRVTYKDVARAAGVSPMTVSYALRKDPRIRLETRRKVEAEAERLGYRPDPEIAKLMAHLARGHQRAYAGTLAFVFTSFRAPTTTPGSLDALLLAAARAQADKFGYAMEAHWLHDPNIPIRRLESMLASRGIAGIVLHVPDRMIENLGTGFARFPVVEIGHSILQPNFHRVVGSHYEDALTVLMRMKCAGYRRIGLVVPAVWTRNTRAQTLAAYLGFVEQNPAQERVAPLVHGEWNDAEFHAWRGRERLDAVFAIGSAAFRAVQAQGIKLPRQLGFVCNPLQHEVLSCSGIRQNEQRKAETAVDMLVTFINRGECGPAESSQAVLVEGIWQESRTLRRKPTKARSGRLVASVARR